MRFVSLAALTLGASLLACSASSEDAASSSSEVNEAPANAACSLDYWKWWLDELKPMLAKPIGEVSEADMNAFVAKHPPMAETKDTYAVCYQPMFAETFYGPSAFKIHQARVDFLDHTKPSYRSLAAYESSIAMTPESKRNAKAILALKPSTMSASDTQTWAFTYDSLLAEVIEPIGVPGPLMYEDVVQDEWVIDANEAEYLAIVEQAASAPQGDGSYREWFESTKGWILGPPMPASNSFVFHLAWEPGSSAVWYQGLEGVKMVGAQPTIPPLVQSFLDRRKQTQPKAFGEQDSSAWMSWYSARGLRTIGDLAQKEPLLTNTDTLALDVLESVKPDRLCGAFARKTWADLMELANRQADHQWSARFAKVEPAATCP